MATKLSERRKTIKGIQKMLWARMSELGFEDVSQFVRASGLEDKISFETIRRSLNDYKKPPSAISVGVVMSKLGFSNDSIRSTMKALGDDYQYLLVPPGSAESTPWLEGLVGAAKEMADRDPNYILHIGQALRLIAGIESIDISQHLARMNPEPRSYQRQLREEPAAQSDEEIRKDITGDSEPEETVKVTNRKVRL